MIVSHEHRFIFVKTRKTAGTSIEIALSALAGEDAIVTPVQPPEEGHCPRNWRRPFNPVPELIDQYVRHEPAIANRRLGTTFGELGRRQAFRNHLPAALIRDRVGHKVWDRYFTFCFERDPWDKTISWYFYVTRKDPDRPPFEEWARTAALPTDWHVYTIGGAVGVDFVGRYEQLDTDLAAALGQVGIRDSLVLPRAEGQLRPAETTELSPTVEERIRQVFENERKEFGYERPAVT